MSNSDHLEVREETTDDGTVLIPVGDIDLSRAPALRQHLSRVLGGGADRIIIDLSEVPYMDSSGVATFVEAMQLARKRGSKLILCGLQERVRGIFEIARLDMVFTIFASRDEARSA